MVEVLDPGPSRPGPLTGRRVGVKDNIAVAGARRTCASAFLTDAAAETDDATVVARLRAAGADVVATLNMAEFALGVTSQNSVHGPVRNPWDPERIPGGSSGGSAAAVALGLVDVALGTDTGGSIRLPAALCGVSGLRPTHGRVPEDGVFPVCPDADVTGPLARRVTDLALVHAVLVGRAPVPVVPARPARIGVPVLPREVDGGVAARVAEAARVFSDGGARLVEVTVPGLAEVREQLYTVVYHDLAVRHAERLHAAPERFQPDTLTRMRLGLDVTAAQRAAAVSGLDDFRRGVAGLFTDVDLLLTPTVPVDAPRVGAEPDVVALTRRVGELTAPWSAHRGPSLSVPAGPHPGSGMPVGLQLVAAEDREDLLLAAGAWFQERTSWHEDRPDLHDTDTLG